jgi:hypothetical protein
MLGAQKKGPHMRPGVLRSIARSTDIVKPWIGHPFVNT